MITYRFSIDIFLIVQDATASAQLAETFTGHVQAERYSHASIKAWTLINGKCAQIRQALGQKTGVGDLHVEAVCWNGME